MRPYTHLSAAVALFGVVALVFVSATGESATITRTIASKEDACPNDVALCFSVSTISASAGDNVTLTFNNTAENSQQHNLCLKVGATTSCTPTETTYLDPGDADTTLAVSGLQAGSWEFWCNFPGHKAAGMKGTLTVSGGTTNGGGPPPNRTAGFETAFAIAGLGAALVAMRRRAA